MKAAETYTKAAARTEYSNARVALELFKKEAKHCADELARFLAPEKDANYKKAVQSYHDAMKALAAMTRVDAQIRNLQEAEKAG